MNRGIVLNCIGFAGLLLCSHSVQAAAIANLDTKEQVFELRTASGFTPVTIAPYGVWRTPGLAVVRFQGREMRIEADQEFAIWNDRDFGPQRTLDYKTHR